MRNTDPTTTNSSASKSREDLLIDLLTPLLVPLGYEIVYLELQLHRQKLLRLFVDHLEPKTGHAIGIEDCVKVSRALDQPLDQMAEIDRIFNGPYELEVSSPGVARPLRSMKDYEKFSGRDVRIHVFRPLTGEELGNTDYKIRNPRQKNFFGRLVGVKGNTVLLTVGKLGTASEQVAIPLPLISKANLEPRFENFDERE